jgi:hypothetical protein
MSLFRRSHYRQTNARAPRRFRIRRQRRLCIGTVLLVAPYNVASRAPTVFQLGRARRAERQGSAAAAKAAGLTGGRRSCRHGGAHCG